MAALEDAAPLGGKDGGVESLTLKRSELLILRKMADRYGVVEGERREMADAAFETLRRSKSARNKLRAIEVLAALDNLALKELAIATGSQKSSAKAGGSAIVQLNINISEALIEKEKPPTIEVTEQLVSESNGHAHPDHQ